VSDLLTRLEPRVRGRSIEPGLAEKIWDTAWLLARQWMFGEFDGEDGGTPVLADVQIDVHLLTGLTLPDGRSVDLSRGPAPLNHYVERERVRTRQDWTVRERIDVGQELLRQLRDAGLTAVIPQVAQAYPLTALTADQRQRDPAAARLFDFFVGRLPDGLALFADAGSAGAPLSRVPTVAGLDAALDGWRRWLADTVDEPGSTEPDAPWDGERLEYSFGLSSPTWNTALQARRHHGGRLDWYSFDGTAGAASGTPSRIAISAIPTPVRFRGMPNPRLWEFEDSTIDFGSVDASPSDLARVALLEFAFAYGNDVFAVPAHIPMSSACTIAALTITDTFGVQLTAAPATRATGTIGAWSFLAPARPDGSPIAALLLVPAANHLLSGPLLEEVHFLRDEMANLVWAVEACVESGSGAPLQRAEEDRRPASGPPVVAESLIYTLQTEVPAWWFPCVLQPGLPRMLQLSVLAPSVAPPAGRVLGSLGSLLREEEISRSGTRVARRWALARWIDGSTRAWSRKVRTVGAGPGSSGLVFDKAGY
jgi:hypothetical protein